MKRLFVLFFVSLMAISMVFAAGPGSVVTGANPEAGADDSADVESESVNGSGGEHQVAVDTANKGESSQLKVQTNSEFGSTIRTQNGSAEAKTEMKMSQGEDGKTYAELSNGIKAEVKVMPDSASEKALEVLGAKCEEEGCEIELKEVGKGEEATVAYEIEAEKPAKFLGIFKTDMKVKAQVDAETGEVVKTKNAWWGFLAKKNLEE